MIGRKRVVLIRPQNDVGAMGIPLGLLRIGTMLKDAGYEVQIADMSRLMDEGAILLAIDVLMIDPPLLFGVTCLTSEVASAVAISGYIKNYKGIIDVPVIWGGVHPTLFPEETCADKSVDYVCIGEGDKSIVELARAIENGTSVKDIAGIAYKENGKVVVNPPNGYVDLESLPPIDYGLIDLEDYVKTRNGIRSVPYQSSRGCPHHCGFCVNTATHNQEYRVKSASKVVREIRDIEQKYGVNYIDFYDDNYFVDTERAADIAWGLYPSGEQKKIGWFAECRVDYFREGRVDRSLLRICQRAGLSQMTLGAESGSQRVLDAMGKGISVGHTLRSAGVLAQCKGITPNYSFMIGLPDETRQEHEMTVELARQVYHSCPYSLCRVVTYTPYPKTAIADELVKKGLLPEVPTLRGWLDKSVRELYTDRFSSKPWHNDKRFIDSIIRYVNIAYGTYTADEMKHWWLKAFKKPFRYRAVLFVLLAQLRMRKVWTWLPLDGWLFAQMEKVNRWAMERS